MGKIKTGLDQHEIATEYKATGKRLVYRSAHNHRFFMRVGITRDHGPHRFKVDFTESLLSAQLFPIIPHDKHIRDFCRENPGEWIDVYLTINVPR